MIITNNQEANHSAVIWLRAQLFEKLSTGELSGHAVKQIKEFPLVLHGENLADAERRLNTFIEEVKSASQR